jgi:multidrug efflux pump
LGAWRLEHQRLTAAQLPVWSLHNEMLRFTLAQLVYLGTVAWVFGTAGLLAAIAGLWIARLDNNIFTQIGLVVLIGLAAKNAILIVEFARQREAEGVPRADAVLEAAKLRLRPILMTSFAFIAGVVPLMLSSGAGAEMRQALGTAVFAGMLGVTFFGIFLTPVFYVLIRNFAGRKAAVKT